MKKIIVAILICALFISGISAHAIVNAQAALTHVSTSTEMRGLWVTSAYNLDWPSRTGLSNAELKREIDDILERAAMQGINAVFVQVRPVGDALYRSSIFPWSHLITGTQGQAPADNFDPLEYWVQEAHARGIEVHAWLNPYRVTFPNQRITDPANLSENHPARINPNLVIAYGNSLFFDPGNPAARQLIIDGAEELLRNYNIDGIHLDDYFYPSRYFPDAATFALHGGNMDIHDWRRENVNTLVRDLQAMTHRVNPNASFGISPTAIWKNEGTDPRGSDTRGFESYHGAYVDTRRWVLEGWVDYIAPQIYWYHGFGPACYNAVLSWWEDLVDGTDVRLYVGLAIYREVQERPNWEGEIIRQLERNARSPVVQGSIFFRERFMRSNVGDAVRAFYTQHLPEQVPTRAGTRPVSASVVAPSAVPVVPLPAPAAPVIPLPILNSEPDSPTVQMDRLMVTQPGRDRNITDAAGFFIIGSGVPNVPVYVNGRLVENRTDEGFFSIFMPLERGRNSFTFTQEGQADVTRVITNDAPAAAAAPTTMAQAAITNASPAANEYARQGTAITLRATAPAGSTVTAQIGGQTISMTQTNANLRSSANNIVAAQFTGSFTLNADGGDNAIVDIGRPVYTAVWEGRTLTATSAGMVRQLGINAPFFAEITAESAWAFPNAATTGGSGWMLVRGQTDRVAAISGDWTRLASGAWVQNANIRTWRDDNSFNADPRIGFLTEARYLVQPHQHVIEWHVPFFPAMQAEFDGTELIISLGMQNVAPPILYDATTSMFSNIRTGNHNGAPAYFMTLRENATLEGFYFEHSNEILRLILRQRRSLTPGQYPFAGFTFIVDAGHGGTDSGAVGAMGASMSEAVIVLAQADLLTERLEALGATVVRIRDTNTFYELSQRVNISRRTKPDMFLSLHTNATAYSTDATNIRGFTVWHRNPNSHPAAHSFMSSLYNINPATNRNLAPNQANLYVARPQWAPHLILEASFTNNINDFAWLINPRRMNDYVWGVVNALLGYYS